LGVVSGLLELTSTTGVPKYRILGVMVTVLMPGDYGRDTSAPAEPWR
jgi:hypothetical protein